MRDIKSTLYQTAPIADLPTESEFAAWLNRQAAQYALTCALAFADDGVIWGRFDGAWKWSGESFKVSPPLRWYTLQQIRLFGKDAEVFVWRANGKWSGRVITDGAGDKREYFDESQLLWGAKDDEEKDGFALMRDGGQGLRHTPPVKIANASNRALSKSRSSVISSAARNLSSSIAQDFSSQKTLVEMTMTKPYASKLHTRNYLDYDQDGRVKIIASRLVDVEQEMAK